MSPVRKKKTGTRKGTTRKKAGRKSSKTGRKAAGGKKRQTSKSTAKPKTRTAKKDAGDKVKAGAARSGGTPGRRAPTVKSARPRSRSRRRNAGGQPAPLFGTAATPGIAHPRLGVKYECYECGAKFYDLNRPEPLCPRCGADQRSRPKRDSRPRAVGEAPPARPEPRRDTMSPLLEEEEDDSEASDDEGLDLDLVDSDDNFLEEDVEDEDD